MRGRDYAHVHGYADVHGTVPYATVNGEIHLVVDHESNRVEVEGIYELTEEESKADSIKTGKMTPLNMDAMKVLEFVQEKNVILLILCYNNMLNEFKARE